MMRWMQPWKGSMLSFTWEERRKREPGLWYCKAISSAPSSPSKLPGAMEFTGDIDKID
jgi:hypothetical protein